MRGPLTRSCPPSGRQNHRPPRAWGNEHCPGPLMRVDSIRATIRVARASILPEQTPGRHTRLPSVLADHFGTEPVATTATTKHEEKDIARRLPREKDRARKWVAIPVHAISAGTSGPSPSRGDWLPPGPADLLGTSPIKRNPTTTGFPLSMAFSQGYNP